VSGSVCDWPGCSTLFEAEESGAAPRELTVSEVTIASHCAATGRALRAVTRTRLCVDGSIVVVARACRRTLGSTARASTARASTARASTARASTARASTARASTARASTARASTARASTARASASRFSCAPAARNGTLDRLAPNVAAARGNQQHYPCDEARRAGKVHRTHSSRPENSPRSRTTVRAREWLSRSPSRPRHPGFPGWLRCGSVTYQQYAPSSRLASRASRPRSSTDLAIPGP
jgi:hypothetical protein